MGISGGGTVMESGSLFAKVGSREAGEFGYSERELEVMAVVRVSLDGALEGGGGGDEQSQTAHFRAISVN